MEDKRGTKRTHSPSRQGSSSPSGGSTPLLVLSGSPSPPGYPSETSSHHPHSPVFEQGGPSKKVPVVDLSSSSNEEGLIPDTSQDMEFVKKLSGDLNLDVLGPPGDGKMIILSDCNEEEEEVREEKTTDAKAAPSSAARSSISTASVGADDAPVGVQDDNSDDCTPDREADGGNGSRDDASVP
jgi:hypothetical protein